MWDNGRNRADKLIALGLAISSNLSLPFSILSSLRSSLKNFVTVFSAKRLVLLTSPDSAYVWAFIIFPPWVYL